MQIRYTVVAVAAVCVFLTPQFIGSPNVISQAQAKSASPILDLLSRASDTALDNLAKPGAFSADDAIRIGLPGGKTISSALKMSDKLGATNNITSSLNTAAESAAAAAKPIFRDAIQGMTLKDGIDVVSGGNTAGTDYLKKSSDSAIQKQLRPLVASALGSSGAYKQMTSLKKLGITEDALTDHVTKGTAEGIYKYMGTEETKLRANPLGSAKSLLKGLGK